MQSRQDQIHSPNTPNQDLEKKGPPGSVAPTRLPAWTGSWGDHPSPGLAPSLVNLHAGQIVSQPGDPYEQEAGQIADRVMRKAAPGSGGTSVPPDLPGTPSQLASSISRAPSMIQRAEAEEGAVSAETTAENAPVPAESTPASDMTTAESASEGTSPGETPTTALIVDDSAGQLQPGQMKKSDFLAQLRDAVCTTTEEALKGTIWSAAGCPWVDHWFGYYANRDSQQIERALRRYAPETANATSASDYIPIICERVRRAIAVWSTTGEVTGLPEGVQIPGSGLMGAMGSIASGVASVGSSIVSGVESVASGIASAGASLVSGAGSALSGMGSMLFKGREGGAREVTNPQAIQGQLGSGSSLDSRVKAPMEQAFGVNFSQVHVHSDAMAAGLSENLNARAFTIGQDIAFGPEEYRPGTLVGDALIAHELAHVVQQRGVNSSAEPMHKGGAAYDALEEDADRSAVGTVVSLWSGAKGGLVHLAQNAMPAMRSGLGLQRCAGTPKQPTTIAGSKTSGSPVARGEQIPDWAAKVNAANDAAAKADLISLTLGKGIQVNVAGTSDTEVENPADYQPFPAVNFDINLNSKRAWSNNPRKRTATRILRDNFGHSFRGPGSTKYLVLGPKVLDSRSPDYTRRAYEHELYHVEHDHLGRKRASDSPNKDDNEELETYTHDFINYFHLLREYGESWKRPILHYERADPDPQKAALDRFVGYYKDPRAQNPLIPADQVEKVKNLFAKWLQDRLNDMPEMQLVQKLDKELGEDTRKRLSNWKQGR